MVIFPSFAIYGEKLLPPPLSSLFPLFFLAMTFFDMSHVSDNSPIPFSPTSFQRLPPYSLFHSTLPPSVLGLGKGQ